MALTIAGNVLTLPVVDNDPCEFNGRFLRVQFHCIARTTAYNCIARTLFYNALLSSVFNSMLPHPPLYITLARLYYIHSPVDDACFRV